MEATTDRVGRQAEPEKSGRSDTSILIHEVKSGQIRLKHGKVDVLGRRLERLAHHVEGNKKFAHWLAAIAPEKAQKLESCGTWLMFRRYYEMAGEPSKLAAGIFCQQPLVCGFCAAGRSARHVGALVEKIRHRLPMLPGHKPYMITLTAKSQTQLKPMIAHLWKGWTTLMQRRRDALKGRSDSITGTWDGGFVTGEGKRGEGGYGWHYHLHGIVLAPGGLYQPVWERLKREWASVIGQQKASVQYQPLSPNAGGDYKDYSGSVIECCKYAVKWSDDDHDDRWTAAQALHRVRSLRTFGSFYGMKLPSEVTDDLDPYEGELFHETVYRFIAGEYRGTSFASQRETAFDDWNDGL